MDIEKYQKKPVVVETIQWTGDNKCLDKIRSFMKPNYPARGTEAYPDCLIIHTLEGDHRASIGDWIIKGVKGEFYPCKPDIFEQTYQPFKESESVDIEKLRGEIAKTLYEQEFSAGYWETRMSKGDKAKWLSKADQILLLIQPLIEHKVVSIP